MLYLPLLQSESPKDVVPIRSCTVTRMQPMGDKQHCMLMQIDTAVHTKDKYFLAADTEELMNGAPPQHRPSPLIKHPHMHPQPTPHPQQVCRVSSFAPFQCLTRRGGCLARLALHDCGRRSRPA